MGIRVKVRVGYTYIGKGRVAYPAGKIFADIDPNEIADQMWKFEELPSLETGEVSTGALDKTTEVLSNADRAKKEAQDVTYLGYRIPYKARDNSWMPIFRIIRKTPCTPCVWRSRRGSS